MADDTVRFSRKPYKVSYVDQNGEKRTIRRKPPAKMHSMLPQDVVSLSRKKNDDFLQGDEFKVKHINPRHPNVLQLEDGDGNTTFVDYYDVNLEEQVAVRFGEDPRDRPINNRYLTWP